MPKQYNPTDLTHFLAMLGRLEIMLEAESSLAAISGSFGDSEVSQMAVIHYALQIVSLRFYLQRVQGPQEVLYDTYVTAMADCVSRAIKAEKAGSFS